MIDLKQKAVIYARVSSREQESGYSLDSQKKLLEEYAQTQHIKVVKVFSVSESASGRKQREVFGEMIECATKRGVKHILCEKTDRLTRNQKDALAIDEWINSDPERRVHFVKESVVLHKESKSNEKFVWNIKVSVAQYYIDNLSEEVKKGLIGKLETGYLPYQPKFGYKSAKQNDKKIHVINEDEAVFVVRMFELYSTNNYSINLLRDMLYKEGMRTRHGKNMSKSRVAAMLADPFYYGALPWKGGLYNRMGSHVSLVTKDMFDRVQAILSGKGAPTNTKHNYSFKKLLVCNGCGCTMTGEMQKGRVYYRCKGYKGCALRSSIREDEIEKQVLGAFEIFTKLTETEREQVRLAVVDLHKEDSDYREKSLQKLLSERQNLETQRDVLYEDRLATRIPIEKWQLKDKEYEHRLKGVEEALSAQTDNQTNYFKLGSSLVDLAFKAEKLYEALAPDKRRELLRLVFANIRADKKKVLFSFVKPLERLVQRIQDRIEVKTISEPQQNVATQARNTFSQVFYSIGSAQ